jgi:hypothetical protein
MRMRCAEKSVGQTRKDYFLRGIRVCKRWEDFANFLADMGYPGIDQTLDRIDPNGNYEPGNCRWATRVQQAGNTRRNKVVEVNGETMLLSHAIEMLRRDAKMLHPSKRQ